MRKKIPVSLMPDRWVRYVRLLEDAVDFYCKPITWRASEYAATKAHAGMSLEEVVKQLAETPDRVELPYFSWGVLEGELARYHQAPMTAQCSNSETQADLRAFFSEITEQCQQDPDVGWAIKRLQMIERKRHTIGRLQAEVDALEKELAKL